MKRLVLKLFSLIVIKRLTSALKQTLIARHSFGTVKTICYIFKPDLMFANCSNNVLKYYL